MHSTPYGASVQDFRDDQRPGAGDPADRPAAAAGARLGLWRCGIYAIGTATHDDIPGSPDYYVIRQARVRRRWGSC